MIQLLVFYAALCFLSVMFSDVSSIALGAPRDMKSTVECHMAPFSIVLALWNARIYISTTNCHDESSNVESMVNNVLSCRTTLGVPDIHPNYCYVRFGGSFNNIQF